VISLSTLATNASVKLNVATNRTFALPLLIFFPTARCNSRCISCDWWRADGATDLTLSEIDKLAGELPALHTRRILFTGGEPLVRGEVFEIADLFRARGIRLWLLTSGLLLDKYAEQIAERFDEVTISLDGHTAELYKQIRGVNALELVERGVAHLQKVAPNIPVRARTTLHRHNFAELPNLIDKAKEMRLAQISFLSADVTSEAFGRHEPGARSDRTGLLLDTVQVEEFTHVVEKTIKTHPTDFETRFIAESPEKLRRLPRYYAALTDRRDPPLVECNAPWMSVVVEADGSVRPCYFHRAVGNIRETGLAALLNHEMVAFRRGLDVAENETCRKCVCTLKVGWRTRTW
jgi:MoaA/NifB/PqqE/SkfB family radical SAM enzyme